MKSFLLLLTLALLLLATSSQASETTTLPLLHTSASAEVLGDNDSATIQVSIITEDKRLESCHKQNALKADNVSSAIQKMKIKNLKITTTNYRVFPKQNPKSKTREIVGYEIHNNLAITLEGVTKEKLSLTVSQILDQAVSSGANQIGALSFYIKDKQPLINQALAQATKYAMSKAQTVSQTAGVTIGDLYHLSTDSAHHNPYLPRPFQERGLMKAASTPTTPIEAGQSKISATVYLSYRIK